MQWSEEVYIDSIWDLELALIGHAETWEQLKQSFQSILTVIANQGEGEDPYVQVALISAAYRKATRKAGELLLKKEFQKYIDMNDFAWLSFGGEARREVTLKFDQDNGIIFATDKPELKNFAEEMVDRLAWLKMARCEGGVMASNPKWQGSVDEWKRRITFLLTGRISEDDLRQLTILLDVDFVFGNREVFQDFVDSIREKFNTTSAVKRMLAEDIVSIPPYLTIFGNLAKETRSDRRGKFNFKFACIYPLVGAARIDAWSRNITIASTRHRIKFLYEKGFYTDKEFEKLNELFKSILYLRLAQQRRQLKKGEMLSDYFDLDLYTKEELYLLKKCVREVEKMKKRLRWAYWL
jgi:CBS domain-containing protein